MIYYPTILNSVIIHACKLQYNISEYNYFYKFIMFTPLTSLHRHTLQQVYNKLT